MKRVDADMEDSRVESQAARWNVEHGNHHPRTYQQQDERVPTARERQLLRWNGKIK